MDLRTPDSSSTVSEPAKHELVTALELKIVAGADVGLVVVDVETTLVMYLLGQAALLGFVMTYESTDKATLALLSLGVTHDLLKF